MQVPAKRFRSLERESVIEGSLETSDNMGRLTAEMERVREKRKSRREKSRREKSRRKKIQVREKVGKS
jgi:hypothetical protein